MRWWLLSLGIVSASAQAAPTYPDCSVSQDGKAFAVEVTADEDNQKAIVALPITGRVVTRTAMFSPDEVKILDGESTWIIDRRDLGFRRVTLIGENRYEDAGSCSIKPAPAKRAF